QRNVDLPSCLRRAGKECRRTYPAIHAAVKTESPRNGLHNLVRILSTATLRRGTFAVLSPGQRLITNLCSNVSEQRAGGRQAEQRPPDGLVVHALQLHVAGDHVGIASVALERARREDRRGA